MRDCNKISQNIKFNIIKVSNKIANELKYYTKAVFNAQVCLRAKKVLGEKNISSWLWAFYAEVFKSKHLC